MWVKVKWINPLFAAFNAAFPQRETGSDGTIGDLEHAEGVSGHNPDDTKGVQAERQDADTTPEVRAADVTSLLRKAGITMYMVVQSILATPAERDRLIYIICDGWIWKKSNGWRREVYGGADKHFGHAHFSGDPASDEDGGIWTSVLKFAEAQDMDNNQAQQLTNLHEWVKNFLQGNVTGTWPHSNGVLPKMVPNEKLNKIDQTTTGIAAGGVTQDMVTAGLKEALKDPEVLAVLRPVLVDAAAEGAEKAEDS